jgi:hypothetical protein
VAGLSRYAHPLLPTAMAFVSYGFVLVRVRFSVFGNGPIKNKKRGVVGNLPESLL